MDTRRVRPASTVTPGMASVASGGRLGWRTLIRGRWLASRPSGSRAVIVTEVLPSLTPAMVRTAARHGGRGHMLEERLGRVGERVAVRVREVLRKLHRGRLADVQGVSRNGRRLPRCVVRHGHREALAGLEASRIPCRHRDLGRAAGDPRYRCAAACDRDRRDSRVRGCRRVGQGVPIIEIGPQIDAPRPVRGEGQVRNRAPRLRRLVGQANRHARPLRGLVAIRIARDGRDGCAPLRDPFDASSCSRIPRLARCVRRRPSPCRPARLRPDR